VDRERCQTRVANFPGSLERSKSSIRLLQLGKHLSLLVGGTVAEQFADTRESTLGSGPIAASDVQDGLAREAVNIVRRRVGEGGASLGDLS
jgi:hypothetical protein